MNNLLPYCGLNDAKMRASEKKLPVPEYFSFQNILQSTEVFGQTQELIRKERRKELLLL
jgi:hypothetical protein